MGACGMTTQAAQIPVDGFQVGDPDHWLTIVKYREGRMLTGVWWMLKCKSREECL
jgi:hypothetical protein